MTSKNKDRGIPKEAWRYEGDWLPTRYPAINKPCQQGANCAYMHGCKFKHEPEHGYEWYVKHNVRYNGRSAERAMERAADRAATYAEKVTQQKKPADQRPPVIIKTKHAAAQQQAAAAPPHPKSAQGGQGQQELPQANPQVQPQALQPQQPLVQRQLSEEEFAKRRFLELELRITQEKVSVLMQLVSTMDDKHPEFAKHSQMLQTEFERGVQANKRLVEEVRSQEKEYRRAQEAQEARRRAEEAQEEQKRAEEAREAQGAQRSRNQSGNSRGASQRGRGGYYHPYK